MEFEKTSEGVNAEGVNPEAENVARPHLFTEKGVHNIDAQPDLEVQQGHLGELEVDLDKVLQEHEVGDYSLDTSPYPAVRSAASSASHIKLELI